MMDLSPIEHDLQCSGCGLEFETGDVAFLVEDIDIKVRSNKVVVVETPRLECHACNKARR